MQRELLCLPAAGEDAGFPYCSVTTVDDDLRHCRHATVSVGASCPSLHVRWIFVSLPNIRGGRPTFLLLTTIYHSDINETVRFHCDVRNRWSRALSACKVMCSCTTYLVLQRVDRAHFSFAARNFPSLFGPIARSTTRTRRSGRDGTPGSTRRGPMRRPQRARRRRGGFGRVAPERRVGAPDTAQPTG